MNVAGRRGGITGGSASADGIVVRAEDFREMEWVQIFLEIREAGVVGVVPGGVHHLRMMGICRPNDVVKILDIRGGVRCGFIPDAVPVGGGKILHEIDEVLEELLVGRATAGGGDFSVISD